jgi:FkbM family methyltransferase
LVTQLPWGWPIQVDPTDSIGNALLRLGVYDLAVSEVLWRLTDEAETTLDIGANLGYMTALLAKRVGSRGLVLCFEPEPENAAELSRNAARWCPIIGDAVIQLFSLALSECDGTVTLERPPGFTHNRGTGRIVVKTQPEISRGSLVSVPCSTLDRCLQGFGNIGIAKMDVEGHEEAVLRGGHLSLRSHRVRDWVFEHHGAYPSAVTDLYEANGYRVFVIGRRFWKPLLLDPSTPIVRSPLMPQSFLATLDADRAKRRMGRVGWECLG